MNDLFRLPAAALYTRCTLQDLMFDTTAQLEDLPGLPGQERAREAIELAIGMPHRGYNVFVLGPAGLGKRSLVCQLLEGAAAAQPAPLDWCYVNNFLQPHRPRALSLPHGRAVGFRRDMARLIEELRASIPAMFESEEYRTRAEQIDADVTERQEGAFTALGREAGEQGIALIHTPAGFSLAPLREGQVLTPEQYQSLPEKEREAIEAKMLALQDQLQKTVRHVQRLQREKRDRLKQLNRDMTLSAVGHLTEELRADYASLPGVLAYLDEVQNDIQENIDAFRRPQETEAAPMQMLEQVSYRRYEVNVIVGDGAPQPGAPVVIEDNPTYINLLGRVEYGSRFGTLVTDFALIKAGALHRANGGYLLVDAHKLLSQPFAWDGLKRVLSTGELRIEALGQSLGLVNTVALEPEPIPLRLKVVLLGERFLYQLLSALDPEFFELFKVQADFEDDFVRDTRHEQLYARLIAALARREMLLPLDRAAVARIIEQGARMAGDAERISAHLEGLADLLRESDHFARVAGAEITRAEHVEQAIDAQRRRAGRIGERVRDAIVRGELLIRTDGEQVGQVNGLSVTEAGNVAIGFPTRITATTRLGDGEVIDIQREIDLSGPIHSKGVMILAGYLASRYSADRPHPLAASLVFEQTYGMVDGDSASVAELCALLSSLGRFPLTQSLAVTGAIDQHGTVQPIGGVNEKIEGFFDVCKARGLSGRHGVVIPAANVKHLMLRADVVAAAAQGDFSVHAVRSVDEALALLAGAPAGEADEQGNFPEGSLNFRIAVRLVEMSLIRQAFANPEIKVRRVRNARAPEEKAPGKRNRRHDR